MITGAIKGKVDKIWTDLWSGGISDPLKGIEQLTYLMFIHDLDEQECETERLERLGPTQRPRIFPSSSAGQSMRWSRFKDRDPREMFTIVRDRVFPAIKAMHGGVLPDPTTPDFAAAQPTGEPETAFARYMEDAIFLIPTPQMLQKLVSGLDELYEHDLRDQDVRGDLYEYMLCKLATSGRNGQFRTPKHIRELMVALVAPTPDDTICDPACGTAGFLISAAEWVRAHYAETMTEAQWRHFEGPLFTGFDMDRTMLRISAMNLMLHGIRHPEIAYQDSVSKQCALKNAFTVCLANPPFKGNVDEESISPDLRAIANTKKTELLFVALFLRLLKLGGRCACIVPDGVLFGSSKAHRALRQTLVEDHALRAVISMPSGVFKPYAGVSTAILVFTKTASGGTDKVWFYDMHADGFSLDDKRNPIEENDIPDILVRFAHLDTETDRPRTAQSFLVPKADIAANAYDLSINKYKEIPYVPVSYPPTSQLLAELKSLNAQAASTLADLEAML